MAKEPLPEGKLSPPVVPARNDPKSLEPYSKSQALQLQGLNPDFHHEWFLRSQLPAKLRQHEIGDASTGFLMVDGWEVVDNKQGVTQGRQGDAAGTPVDTAVTAGGELVLCRTTKDNYAKYAVIERKRDELIDARLARGQSQGLGSQSTIRTRTAGGAQSLDTSVNDILRGVA